MEPTALEEPLTRSLSTFLDVGVVGAVAVLFILTTGALMWHQLVTSTRTRKEHTAAITAWSESNTELAVAMTKFASSSDSLKEWVKELPSRLP